MQEMSDVVQSAVSEQVQGVAQAQGMQNLKGELEKRGLNDEQINDFVNFASKNPAEYGIDGAINMWQAVTQNQAEANVSKESPLDVVRQNQSVPQQAGILSGEKPVAKDEKDSMWEGILKAGSRNNVL